MTADSAPARGGSSKTTSTGPNLAASLRNQSVTVAVITRASSILPVASFDARNAWRLDSIPRQRRL